MKAQANKLFLRDICYHIISNEFMTFDNRATFHCKYEYFIIIIIIIT